MYIGNLCEFAKIDFFSSGTERVFLPDVKEENLFLWKWNRVFDSSIDILFSFGKLCYIGAVEWNIRGGQRISVITEGVTTDVNSSGHSPLGIYTNKMILRIRGNLQDIEVRDIRILGSFEDGKSFIFPTVKKQKEGDGRVKFSAIVTDSEEEDVLFAESFFASILAERGMKLSDEGIALHICKEKNYEEERFTAAVSADGAVVKAGSRLALLRILSLLCDLGTEDGFPEIEIDDTPDVQMRGFHMGLPRIDRFDFTKKLFKYVLLPLGYNQVIIEFSGAMRYDSHPEIGEKWLEAAENYAKGLQPRMPHSEMGADSTLLEKAQVGELVDYIRSLGFEVIPEIQSLGHVQYLTYAHPELAEVEEVARKVTDTRGEDERPPEFYYHSYCPAKKESLEIIFDLIDELVELIQPKRFVHIGHDETYQIGSCPICRKRKKADIFLEHVLALKDYISAKGLKTMLWTDMLHDDQHPYSRETAAALKGMPTDLIFLDFSWYFTPEKDIEDNLLNHGNRVIMGNLYSSHYPRFSSRIKKEGVLGGELSTWIAVSEEDYADNGKMFDLSYTAQMLNRAYSYDESLKEVYRHLIGNKLQAKQRDAVRGKLGTGSVVEELCNFEGTKSELPVALKSLLPQAVAVRGGEVKIDGYYNRLIFEQATLFSAPRIPWQPLIPVGSYTVYYEDGSRVEAKIRYAGEVLAWNRRFGEPLPQQYYRHQGYIGTWYGDPVFEGKTAEGEDVLFLGFVFENPHPEKKIEKVSYSPDEKDICTLITKGIKGVKFLGV